MSLVGDLCSMRSTFMTCCYVGYKVWTNCFRNWGQCIIQFITSKTERFSKTKLIVRDEIVMNSVLELCLNMKSMKRCQPMRKWIMLVFHLSIEQPIRYEFLIGWINQSQHAPFTGSSERISLIYTCLIPVLMKIYYFSVKDSFISNEWICIWSC